jgi:hypothetical protein
VSGLFADDAHFAEQFPLSPLDDYLIHQTPDPIRVMWTGDPRAYDRYWMLAHQADDDLLIAAGGSFYPNLDRAEAYAIVNYQGRHHSVRAFRPLGVDRADLRMGPIAPEIVHGLRHWRFTLGDNPYGIRYELDFVDTTRQVFREPLSNLASGIPPGRRNDVTTGFECFGVVNGWVEVDGTRIDVAAAAGTRDRHWGTGRGVGGPALSLGGRLHLGVNANAFVAFDDWTLWGDRIYYYFGDQRKGALRVNKPSRRMAFEPDTKIFREAVIEYPLDNGETKTLHYERIAQETIYLRCGMYGGTPGSDIHQGSYGGPEMVEGEILDVNDPFVRTRLTGLNEHLCRVTCGDEVTTGVLQTIDPLAYETCASGRPGWDFL